MSLDRPEGRAWVGVLAIELSPTATKPLTSQFIVTVVEEQPLDTGSDALKAESAPQIAEIAKLLKGAPKLSVLVVGHTDTQGALDVNRALSERRAAAVVAALTGEHGIEKARLVAVGVGPAAPVATNRTEDGRARNRRVEIVELGP